MHISLVTAGTRGDAQPMVLLALELCRRGHSVELGVPPNLVGWARRAGVSARPFGPDSQQVMQSPQGQEWLASGNMRAFMKGLVEVSSAHQEQTARELAEVVQNAEVVVAGVLAEDLALPYAQRADVPLVLLHSFPTRRNAGYPSPMLTTRRLPRPLNLAAGSLWERVWWAGQRAQVAALRQQLGLPPERRSTAAQVARAGGWEIQAYSPLLVPRTGYGPRRPLVGFLQPTDELRGRLGEAGIDADLEAWLADGEAPVYFGFGSMPVTDPREAMAIAMAACRDVGVRALISAGWAGLAGEDTDHRAVRVVDSLDHGAVLPRCRAAVHHGGAGTTAAALTAGLPSLVCSVFADQPFWGARIQEVGSGRHLPFSQLNRATLTSGLGDVLGSATADRAARLGRQLRDERDATPRAADIVEQAS